MIAKPFLRICSCLLLALAIVSIGGGAVQGATEKKDKDAIIWKNRSYKYEWLLQRISYWQYTIEENNIKPGSIAILEADFSPDSVALFLSLIEKSCVLVPLTSSVEANKPEFIEIAQGEVSFLIDDVDQVKVSKFSRIADHDFYRQLRTLKHPGLILFSSGSTGKSKAAVHDLLGLLYRN